MDTFSSKLVGVFESSFREPSIITEVKPASPSMGSLRDITHDLKNIISSMNAGGASAISVLVEPSHFNGSIDLIKKIRKYTSLPIIAKGFFFETRHIQEVADAGANAFLLMVRIIESNGGDLQKIIHFGASLGLDAMVEVGTSDELYSAVESGAKIIEINARFGDPENMNVLPLLKTDFIELCKSMLDKGLSNKKIQFQEKSTVCKYVVPEGYGVKSMVGEKIQVGEEFVKNAGAKLFYASVNKKNDDIFTTSSRSLAIVGIADQLSDAEEICEKALTHVKGDHIFIRHDIGTIDLIEKRVNHMNELRGT